MELKRVEAEAAEQQKKIEELKKELEAAQAAAEAKKAAIANYNQLLQELVELDTLNNKASLTNEEIEKMNSLKQGIKDFRDILPENLYTEAIEEANKIKKENERFAKDRILEAAYDSMLDDMIILRDLEGVSPTSDEERDQLDEQREELEEKIKRAQEILPIEFQRVIKEGVEHVIAQRQPRRPQSTPHNNPQTGKRTLDQIMYGLQEGLPLRENSGEQLIASQTKVSKKFKQEIRAGGLFSVISSAASAVKSGFKKVVGKFSLWATNQQSTVEILEDRINNLSEDDLVTILTEYVGDKVKQDSYPSTLNVLLNARAQRFLTEKVEEINEQISSIYTDINQKLGKIKKLNDSEISEKAARMAKRMILNGTAEQIGELRELYNEANQYTLWAEGFNKEMNETHRRPFSFGKKTTNDSERQQEKATLTMQESEAVEQGNDEEALRAFVGLELLKSEDPNYSPLVRGQREAVEQILNLAETDNLYLSYDEAPQRGARR